MATSRDWQCDKSLTECIEHMFKYNIATDVTFLCGEDRNIIHAHKFILMSRSPVFYAMLEGPMSEKGEITIPDIQGSIFNLLLRYLYTDKIQLNIYTVVGLLAAARKYFVDRLFEECKTFIKENLILENAGVLLEEAHIHVDDDTTQYCLQLIWDSPEEFLESKNFGYLCSDCLKSITDSDELTVREEYVYEAVMRWSEDECRRQGIDDIDENRRHVLGDNLYTVRFPLLRKDYFAKVATATNLLTAEESVSVSQIQLGEGNVLNHTCNFKTKQRKIKQIPQRVMHFDQVYHAIWSKNKYKNCLAFTISNNVTMHGICMYKTRAKAMLKVTLYDGNKYQLYNEQHAVFPGKEDIMDVIFKQKLHLIHSQTYILVVPNNVSFKRYGIGGMRLVTVKSTNINFLQNGGYNDIIGFMIDNRGKGPIAGLLLSGV